MKYLYGVFLPTDYPGYDALPQNRKWAMRDTLEEAVSVAKAYKDYDVVLRRMPYPDGGAWDMTTFKMCSDLIS